MSKRIAEVLYLFEQLPRIRLGDRYTEQDRASDFLAVFNGESNRDQGQRVLSQIVEFCSPSPNPNDADKPGTLAFKDGRRWVLGELMRCFVMRLRVPEIERTPKDA